MYSKPMTHLSLNAFLMPQLLIAHLLVGTSRGDAGNISWLLDGVGTVEEEVGLPVLEGGAVGGED